MLQSIPSTLFAEWMAFYRLEPFGEWRADLRAGIIASTIAEVNRDSDVRREPFGSSDFMPVFDPLPKKKVEKPALSMDVLKDKIFRAFGVKKD